MAKTELKIITDVLISQIENRLKLVDIYFTDKIEKIVPKTDQIIDWNDISNHDRWMNFQRQFSTQNSNSSDKIYDGKFLLLVPGAIDSHVHFNTPGFEERDDFEHGSLAAAYGGVTTVIDMPCTSIPPVTSLHNLQIKLNAIKGRSWIDYAFWGGISGQEFHDQKKLEGSLQEMLQAGVKGFKAYLISGMKLFTDLPYDQMLQLAHLIRKTKLLLAVHAEDKSLIMQRQQQFEELGRNDWQAYCQSRDDKAEASAVARMINIAHQSDCRIHIVHLSSRLALELIRSAKAKGVKITAETCPHYLYFTQQDFENPQIAASLKTAPPVKNEADKEALWQGLNDGTLSFVTTDHAGCDPEKEKASQNFWDIYGGIPGVEHRVPFLFSEGCKKNRLTISQTIELLSTNPAQFFNLNKNKGSLTISKDADMVLVNLWESEFIKAENMHSRGKYTPFEGREFTSVIDSTFVRGSLVISRNWKSEVKIGFGQFLGNEIR